MSIKFELLQRIYGYANGKVFITADFLDLASNETVRKTLNRLVEEATIQRVIAGFYFYPAYSPLIGEYESVSIQELAQAIARKYNWTIAPSGNAALNMLGLSTQVPSKWIYNSTGPYKTYAIGNTTLEFKRTKPSEIAHMSKTTALVIQAIKVLGKNSLSQDAVRTIRNRLSEEEIKNLLTESTSVPSWMYETIREIGMIPNKQD